MFSLFMVIFHVDHVSDHMRGIKGELAKVKCAFKYDITYIIITQVKNFPSPDERTVHVYLPLDKEGTFAPPFCFLL